MKRLALIAIKSDSFFQIVCRYRECLSTMFAGEIDVDEMVEIFSLMYTVQVVIVSICNFTFKNLYKL